MNECCNVARTFIVTNLTAFKEAGNSFKHFSNSYNLKDEYYHSLTSGKWCYNIKCSIIGKQVVIILFM